MKNIKRMAQVFITATSLIVGTHAYAATYYFSASGNNTTGNGTQANPWRSLCGPYAGAGCQTGESKISLKQFAINPGDQILFKRGDMWTGMNAVWTVNVAGTPASPITFGAWGDPSLPRPIFRGAMTAYELGKDTWTNVPGTAIWYTTGINWWPNMAAQELTALQGPHLYGAWSVQGKTNANAWLDNQSMVRGTYFYDDPADRLYVWRTDNLKPDHAAGRDIYIGGASSDGTNRLVKVDRGYAGASTDPKYVGGNYIFQDLHVMMARDYGFSTSYPNTQYINCISEMNGMEGFLFDRVRFGAPLPGAKDGVMRNCISRRNNLGQGGSIGQGITVEAENVWLYDSESYENGFAGLDFLDFNANTKTDGGGVVNCKIHNNGIQPVSMYSFDANIYIDGGSNITIRDTQVWGAGIDPRGVKTRMRPNAGIAIDLEEPAFAAGKRPHGIKIVNTTSFGNAGSAIGIGSGNGLQSAVDSFSDIQLIGNTFQREMNDSSIPGYYGPDYFDAGVRVVQFDNIASGFVFKNNIVTALNTAQAPLFGSITMQAAGKSKMDFNNNIYYCPGCNFNTNGGYSSGGLFSYNYISNLTIDQFRNVTAAANLRQDETLAKSVITSNPMLTNGNFSNYDCHLLTNSPALDIALAGVFPFTVTGTTRADGAADNPYNDLGYHYPLTSTAPPPPPDTAPPTVPTGLAASLSGTTANLSWVASTDNVAVTGYQVFEGATLNGTTASLAYAVTNLSGGTHTFTVKAVDAASNVSSASNTASVTISATPYGAPTNVAAVYVNSRVQLTWTTVTGAAGYNVFRNGVNLGNVTVTSYNDAAVTPGSTYTYTLNSYNYVVETAFSTPVMITVPSGTDTTAPSAPTGLTAIFSGAQVSLSWTASTDNVAVAGYEIMNNGALLGTSVSTSFIHNGAPSMTYNYTVRAGDASNNMSASSAIVTVTTPTPPPVGPTAPSNLVGAFVSSQVQLSWSPSTNNIGYNVYRDDVYLKTVGTLSTFDNAVTPGSAYRYKIQAYDAADIRSPFSNEVSVTLPGTPPDTQAPSAPAGLTATLIGTTANLSWSASTDNVAVTAYQVFEGATLKGTTVSLSYAVTGLSTGAHTYTVKAKDAANNLSAASNTASVTVPVVGGPGVPTNLAGVNKGSRIQLTWTASANAYGYNVFRNGAYLNSVGKTSYNDNAVTVGTTYSYAVSAYDASAIESAKSTPVLVTAGVVADTTAPSAPAGLTATLIGTTANLSWSASTDNVAVTGYQVFDGALLKGTTAGLTYSVTSLSVGTHTFTVKAADAANNLSAASNSAVSTVVSTYPATPTNMIAYLSGSSVSVAWSSSANATGYKVYRNGVFLANSATTSLIDSSVTAGQTYSYQVLAYNAAGLNSSLSASMSVIIPAAEPAPAVPGNFQVIAPESGNVTLTWLPSAGAVEYRVYRNDMQISSTFGSFAEDHPGAGLWRYKIKAVNGSGVSSGFTNEVSAFTTR